MGSMNRVFLIGRLGQDPEARRSRSGRVWCTFSLATNRARKEAEGVWTQETDWHAIRAFGPQAEACVRFLRRGSMVSIEGAVTYDKWTDDEGKRRINTRILADRVTFVGDMKKDDGRPIVVDEPSDEAMEGAVDEGMGELGLADEFAPQVEA